MRSSHKRNSFAFFIKITKGPLQLKLEKKLIIFEILHYIVPQKSPGFSLVTPDKIYHG